MQKPMCDAAHTSHRIRSDLERQERTSDLSHSLSSSTVIRYMEAKRYNPVFISGLGHLTGPSAYLISISGGRIVRAAAGAAADQHPGGAILLLTVYS